jgi:predicted GNAT superfamily acetyltransferase
LFGAARAAGHERIVCEVNSDPPNPASEAFHKALGFAPVGEALLGNGKTVTYLALKLAP